jgi:predicted nucleotidyltransferase
MYSEIDLNKIKELLLSYISNAEDIILFGSYARGTASESSDMDFAVLTASGMERREKLELLSQIRWEIAKLGYNADILIKEKRKFSEEIKLPTLSRTIHTEGRYLWTRN